MSFELQPTLVGATILLRPLTAEDFEPLYEAASDPLTWEQHPSPLRYQRDAFTREYFDGALASGASLVVIEKQTGKVIGCSRYYDWNPEKKEVAIGYTFLNRTHWGGPTNQEKKHLMLTHAFRWADKVWFHIGKDNTRSRKAVAKIGAEYSHAEIRDVNGVGHDYVVYAIQKAAK